MAEALPPVVGGVAGGLVVPTTIRAAPGRGGTTAGSEKHGYEDAKSDYQRAFQKHGIFSLNVSIIRNKSRLSEERSHQNALPKLTFAAGYTLSPPCTPARRAWCHISASSY